MLSLFVPFEPRAYWAQVLAGTVSFARATFSV